MPIKKEEDTCDTNDAGGEKEEYTYDAFECLENKNKMPTTQTTHSRSNKKIFAVQETNINNKKKTPMTQETIV